MVPSFLKEPIVLYHPTRALHSHNSGLFVKGATAFSFQAPLLWNHLLVLVLEADTLSTFKSWFKDFLYDKAYSYSWLRTALDQLCCYRPMPGTLDTWSFCFSFLLSLLITFISHQHILLTWLISQSPCTFSFADPGLLLPPHCESWWQLIVDYDDN